MHLSHSKPKKRRIRGQNKLKQAKSNIKNKTTAKLQQKKQNKTVSRKQHKAHEDPNFSIDNDSPVLDDSEDTVEGDNEYTGCGEDYYKTIKTEDWMKCLVCGRWMHEDSSNYTDLCDLCGKHSRKYKTYLHLLKY
ncbi:hypothetical protein QE152_g9048 [Popillia japonica]|uniref:Uncharacterized protein n=1 Tax=Popillia japonica TaxID=7064 RepID=A0AAW1LYK7_POPJA